MCFDDTDLNKIYLYPVESLHVTVATLRAFSLNIISTDDILVLVRFWKDIIQTASTKSDWPKGKIVLELENAQVGCSAGILLWRENSGNLQSMRSCLQSEVDYYKEILDKRLESNTDALRHRMLRESLNAFSIPNIVHTSFLRFTAQPITDGRVVQERFTGLLCENVSAKDRAKMETKSTIHQCFEQNIEIASVCLVVEYFPYRLFPSVDHVLWHCLLD